MSPINTSGAVEAEGGMRPVHPVLRAQLAGLSYDSAGVPDPASWRSFVEEVDERYRHHDDADRGLGHLRHAWSSFENLFRASPTPTMEQDYTRVVEWMDSLRAQGVTDIVEHLGDDLERYREVAAMIRMVAANPAAVEVIGIPEHDLIGLIDPTIVNEGALAGWRSQLDAVWHGRPLSEATFEGATATGKVYDAHSTLSAPVIDGVPDFTRAVLTIVDITAQRQEERRMKHLIDAKNQFLASVSHEIRTPLTAVLGFARLLTAGDTSMFDDEERHEMLAAILEQAGDVTDLVEDLLVAARAEIGQLAIVDEDIDVAAQITQTLDAGGSFTRGVSVRPAEGERLIARGDPVRMRQILRNLLTNAERYGGSDVVIDAARRGDRVVISVSDDGPGIVREHWERIFEPYQRAHESPGQPSSVGIGLTICRQLADLMDASLDYRFEDGRSVFRLGLRAATGS